MDIKNCGVLDQPVQASEKINMERGFMEIFVGSFVNHCSEDIREKEKSDGSISQAELDEFLQTNPYTNRSPSQFRRMQGVSSSSTHRS